MPIIPVDRFVQTFVNVSYRSLLILSINIADGWTGGVHKKNNQVTSSQPDVRMGNESTLFFH